ncbi:START domain-containing protein [Bacteroidota bacterium]
MKKIMKITLLLIIATTFFPSIAMTQKNNWKLEKDENDIKIYTRFVEGSSFKEFKGEITITCEMTEIVKLLKDVSKFKDWVADCEKVELLKFEGSDQYHYIETSIPWPLENRDMVYNFNYLKETNLVTEVIITGKANYIPKKKGIVRMTQANGFWKLISIGENRIEVTYQLHAEPGGVIPAWLANSTVVDMPYNTLNGLKDMLNFHNR